MIDQSQPHGSYPDNQSALEPKTSNQALRMLYQWTSTLYRDLARSNQQILILTNTFHMNRRFSIEITGRKPEFPSEILTGTIHVSLNNHRNHQKHHRSHKPPTLRRITSSFFYSLHSRYRAKSKLSQTCNRLKSPSLLEMLSEQRWAPRILPFHTRNNSSSISLCRQNDWLRRENCYGLLTDASPYISSRCSRTMLHTEGTAVSYP